MAKLNQKETLDLLLSLNEKLSLQAQKLLELDDELLSNKPDIKSWSVLECFDHMNKATELYINQIEKKLPTSKVAQEDFYKSGLFANFFIDSLKPTGGGKIKNKMKTLKAFVPDDNLLDGTVIKQFLNNQEKLLNVVQKLKGKNLNSFKVTTAIGKILKFNVGDALRFITAHNERHMLQAERIQQQIQNI